MADQDCSMCLNQSSGGDNEIQEAAFVEQAGMNENGSEGDLGLEANLRLEDDSSSLPLKSEESLDAIIERLDSEIGELTMKSWKRFQPEFEKKFGFSKESPDDIESKPSKSAIEEDQELEEVEVSSNYLAGHHFFFGPAFKSSQHYKLIRRTIKSARGIPELKIDWSKLLEMEVSHLIGTQEDLINLKSDSCDAEGKSSIRIYHRDSVIEAVRNGGWNCDNNIIGVLKL